VTTSTDALENLRRLLLALAAFGLVGIATELTFLEHYEDTAMFAPFAAIALALAAIGLHAIGGTALTVRLLRLTMAGLVVAGAVGVVLHYRGSLEFQVDMDPTLSASELFWKVMHMKAPPTLAPGVLAQLGLLGLVSTYRHPAVARGR
jgi:hypothetical protein